MGAQIFAVPLPVGVCDGAVRGLFEVSADGEGLVAMVVGILLYDFVD